MGAPRRSHRVTEHPLYNTWLRMRRRCHSPGDDSYPRYGARGIRVCERWHTFANFVSDVGVKPSSKHTLDRIDVNGDYEPGNVRWATQTDQARNTRFNVKLTHGGRTQCVSAWASEFGLDRKTLASRIETGWPIGVALSTPAGADNKSRERIPKSEYDAIQALWRTGMRNIDIARKYGVAPSLICRIIRPIRRSA